jgi:hypothetical protein
MVGTPFSLFEATRDRRGPWLALAVRGDGDTNRAMRRFDAENTINTIKLPSGNGRSKQNFDNFVSKLHGAFNELDKLGNPCTGSDQVLVLFRQLQLSDITTYALYRSTVMCNPEAVDDAGPNITARALVDRVQIAIKNCKKALSVIMSSDYNGAVKSGTLPSGKSFGDYLCFIRLEMFKLLEASGQSDKVMPVDYFFPGFIIFALMGPIVKETKYQSDLLMANPKNTMSRQQSIDTKLGAVNNGTDDINKPKTMKKNTSNNDLNYNNDNFNLDMSLQSQTALDLQLRNGT